jgi:hypothetical protein
VCGHISRHHGVGNGGTYEPPTVEPPKLGGVTWTWVTVLDGCAGAVKSKGADQWVDSADRERAVMTRTMVRTCPCRDFRPVVNIDRPGRYFCQRVTNLKDPTRHPMMLGIKAYGTHLSKRRAALTDPTWPAAEFDRRFVWIDGARVCSIANCKTTDDVWPVFVHDDRSELRCSTHR